MAITRQQKIKILEELTEKFKNAQSIGFAKTTQLSVSEFEKIRNSLREVDASYTIAKKTLIIKVIKDALNIDIHTDMLEWQIWVVCSYSDSVAWLWKIDQFIKESKGKKMNWAASIFEWKLRNLEDTIEIAWIPSRDTLLGRLVGSMQSPLSALARFFDAAKNEIESSGKIKLSDIPSTTQVSSEEKKDTKTD